MARAMKQMGIQSQDIAATRVVIEQEGGRIVIEEPQIVRLTIQGQASFQISGKVSQQLSASAEDVKMVMEATGADEKAAAAALAASGGDLAEAILALKKE